jgi:transglutaminase-like putative cysteine protease
MTIVARTRARHPRPSQCLPGTHDEVREPPRRPAVAGATTPEARALAQFRFVRDEIHFGLTPRFDLASAEETLVFGRGHCNPKAVLFASLLRAARVEARLYLVTISNEILAGIFPPPGGPPVRLAHTFTEVRLAGEWRRVDGYMVDPMLHARAVPRLRAEGAVSAGGCTWTAASTGTGEATARHSSWATRCSPARITARASIRHRSLQAPRTLSGWGSCQGCHTARSP